jgi:NSS family neurotransmitter:Na+ symporter
MLTYGSYVDEGADLLRSSLLITVADITAALLAGLVIFPIVFSFGLAPTLGTELAFTTLPAAFASMGVGRVVAVAFFGLLFFAALSSSVALLEVGVAAATNTTRLDRVRATRLLTAGVFVAGLPSALSYSPLELAVAGTPVLDLVDESVGTYALPVSAVLIALVFVWGADFDPVRDELGRLYPLVRYLLPPALVAVTGAKAVGVARPAWRLLLDGARDETLALVATAVALATLGAIGWLLRARLPYSRRGGRGRG